MLRSSCVLASTALDFTTFTAAAILGENDETSSESELKLGRSSTEYYNEKRYMGYLSCSVVLPKRLPFVLGIQSTAMCAQLIQ